MFDKYTPLHAAAAVGDSAIKMAELLLENGANVRSERRGETSLHVAAFRGDEAIKIAKLLLEKGGDIHSSGQTVGTPLHRAVSTLHPRLEMVRMLIDHGANVNAYNHCGAAVLVVALAWVGVGGWNVQHDVIQLLSKHGAKDPRFLGFNERSRQSI